jgi:trimethylamine--corrinoid protein Co-methyltransferase
MAALAGANLIYGSGMIESGVTFDCGQFVMDNEFARMIKYCVAGIQVDDGTLMIDEIARVGSFGDFLSLDSTYALMRAQSQPSLLDRRVREDWKASGGSDLYSRAAKEAREIVAGHKPEPLDADVLRRLQAIVEAADRETRVA